MRRKHHIDAYDLGLQDLGNYEEFESGVIMTSLDGGFRGEVLKVRDITNEGRYDQESI